MRAILGGVLAMGFVALGSYAGATSTTGDPQACKYTWNSMSAADKAKTTYSDYLKVCMENGPTAAPTAATRAVPPEHLNTAEKKQACQSRWLTQKKITPTGSQDETAFMAKCMSAK